ncbi:hypothetical protein FDA47_17145 [Clostridium botulinum]|nr:hypothetical protein [Clostridium botulinum]
MFVKNSSMSISYREFIKDYKYIIDKFVCANANGVEYISMSYLLKNTKISQTKLYDQMHELLEMNILDMKEFTTCPYCSFDNVLKNNNIRCCKCKNLFNPNNIIEKFKIKVNLK